ncbi:MAG: gliding motility protein GldM [Dysgonamonadaceae bacterium]|jgi:gliding motility-associated protein GldM|nr:gliding motility protein GldM [Dysgonamonadaceae bacterium]
MAANSPNSPRQKMINLMYLVFIAMLAFNVSTEVLDGFVLVEDSLTRTMLATSSRNEMIFGDLEEYHDLNPEKTEKSYDYAKQVKDKSDSLFNYTQELKMKIVQKSDGKDGDLQNLKRPDNLDASYDVMFERGKNDGKKLKEAIDSYRDFVTALIIDTTKRNIVRSNLSTEISAKAKEKKQTWEESMFWKMPVVAAVTLLTKLQSDIRYAESEVLSELLRNIDLQDYKVNKIEAQVIPQSQIVMRGQNYVADLVLSALDSTQQPTVYVNGKMLPPEVRGRYTVGTGSTGTFPLSGYIELNSSTGMSRYDFSTHYSVVEPSATVASQLMNVMYPGINNPVRIAVPGVPSSDITATMTNGTLTRENENTWIARPAKAGEEAIISVQAKTADGRLQEMGKSNFKVRPLPTPSTYLMVADAKGNLAKFEGGFIGKAALLNVDGIKVGIDDGLLNIPFTVLHFETTVIDNLGMDVRETAQGADFTERQKTQIRGVARGKRVLIRGIVARGPDGVERNLRAPLEIMIN